jgi:hypothetical protein
MKSRKLPNIIWLASYPKSGNTWFRAFLTNLMSKSNQPADINDLFPSTIASSRQLFDEISGIPSADLTFSEIDKIRSEIYRLEGFESEEIQYHKIHDAFIKMPNGKSIIPASVTKAVLYFIRNPLDVAVSFAHHQGIDLDKTIQIMNDEEFAFCFHNDRLHNQMHQVLLSWSRHVQSWVDYSKLPLMVIRYEDMYYKGLETFKQAVSFVGFSPTNKEIYKALKKSTFENLKKQEIEKGFREKNSRSESFFRKGIPGDWKNVLSKKQINQIVKVHKKFMERFGYFPLK